MADENDIAGDSAADEEPKGPVAGERLAAARRELQIPVSDIAKELHLDEFKVRALESNDFDVIGAPVFAKGHLRKYAQLVKVSAADVMADYYHLNRSVAAPPVVASRVRPRRVISPGPWIAAIIVIALAVAAYWWVAVRVVPAEPAGANTIAPLPAVASDAADDAIAATGDAVADNAVETGAEASAAPAETDDGIEPLSLPEATDPSAADRQAGEMPAADVAAAGSPETRLTIRFSGDCWTEITDSSGRRLFFGLGKAGRTVQLSGMAPLNVLFGDADNASIDVDGEPYTISATERRGKTARLTISGS